MKPLKLTNRQAEVLAICSLCESPVEVEKARKALEANQVRPGTIICSLCNADPKRAYDHVMTLAAMTSAARAAERARSVGLGDHFEQAATEAVMRSRNQQN